MGAARPSPGSAKPPHNPQALKKTIPEAAPEAVGLSNPFMIFYALIHVFFVLVFMKATQRRLFRRQCVVAGPLPKRAAIR